MKCKVMFSVIICFFVFSFNDVLADVPHMINYQGKLTTAEGGCLNDTVQMTFTIYSDSLGTSEDWSETQDEVVVKEGVFSVLLGSVDTIPTAVFDGNMKYLGVQVASDPEMRPLKPIVSVAYAWKSLEADTADYVRVAEFADSSRVSGEAHLADSANTAYWADSAEHGVYADTARYADTAHFAFTCPPIGGDGFILMHEGRGSFTEDNDTILDSKSFATGEFDSIGDQVLIVAFLEAPSTGKKLNHSYMVEIDYGSTLFCPNVTGPSHVHDEIYLHANIRDKKKALWRLFQVTTSHNVPDSSKVYGKIHESGIVSGGGWMQFNWELQLRGYVETGDTAYYQWWVYKVLGE